MTSHATPAATVIIPTMGAPQLGAVVTGYLDDGGDAEILVIVDKPGLTREELGLPEHDRLRVEVNPANIGLTRTLNRAIGLSRGEIMIRNDDDDLPEPGRVAAVLAKFDQEPATDIVFSLATGRDQGTGREWTIDAPMDDAGIKQALLKRNVIVHSTLAFRKKSLAPIGFYDETFRYAQDYDLYLRAIRHGLRFSGIPRSLVTRIYHDRSITVARRRQQIMFSFAARIVHVAHSGDLKGAVGTIVGYTRLLLVPDWMRRLRRALGKGR